VIELSPRTRAHVSTLFKSADVEAAERLLAQECAENLPMNSSDATPAGLERVRFAAIRVSGGSLDRLREAIRLAQIDWRDLLVSADFALRVDAHERWHPIRFDAAVVARWRAGDLPHGVAFDLNHRVRVISGRRSGKRGAVISLLGLEPEPLYRVELSSGEALEAYQRMLEATR
jgi:hypothetical protein